MLDEEDATANVKTGDIIKLAMIVKDLAMYVRCQNLFTGGYLNIHQKRYLGSQKALAINEDDILKGYSEGNFRYTKQDLTSVFGILDLDDWQKAMLSELFGRYYKKLIGLKTIQFELLAQNYNIELGQRIVVNGTHYVVNKLSRTILATDTNEYFSYKISAWEKLDE